MTESTLPSAVRALVHGPVATMLHVELLLRARTCAPAAFSEDVMAAAAHVAQLAMARRCLDQLVAAGLLERGDDGRFRYAPRDETLAGAVDALAATYNEKPVTLVRALYDRPPEPGPQFPDQTRSGRRTS